MKQIALYPGSFDPITFGHIDIINRATALFDEVVIAIGENTTKKYLFDLEKRLQFIKTVFESNQQIKIITYKGLTVDYCKVNNINFIVRGIRNTIDYEYEKAIAETNKLLNPTIETVFLNSSPAHQFISSTIVREIILSGGNTSGLVPDIVKM